MEEELRGPLFPKVAGGYSSPQESGSASSGLHSCKRISGLGLGTCSGPSLTTVSGRMSRAVEAYRPGTSLPGEGGALQRGNGANQILACLFSL